MFGENKDSILEFWLKLGGTASLLNKNVAAFEEHENKLKTFEKCSTFAPRNVEINPKQFYFPLAQSAGENFHRKHQQQLLNFAIFRLIKLFTATNSRNSLFFRVRNFRPAPCWEWSEIRVLDGEKTIELPNRSFQKFISQSMLPSIFFVSTALRHACCE